MDTCVTGLDRLWFLWKVHAEMLSLFAVLPHPRKLCGFLQVELHREVLLILEPQVSSPTLSDKKTVGQWGGRPLQQYQIHCGPIGPCVEYCLQTKHLETFPEKMRNSPSRILLVRHLHTVMYAVKTHTGSSPYSHTARAVTFHDYTILYNMQATAPLSQ